MTTMLLSDDPREILDQIIADLRRRAENYARDPRGNLLTSTIAGTYRDLADGLEFPHTMTREEYEKSRKLHAEIIRAKQERKKGEAV